MIKNDKQYQITRRKLKEFTDALVKIQSDPQLEPLLKELHVKALRSQIEEFESIIKEYESLKNGDVNFVYVESIEKLPEALIKGRISLGWSQAELAYKLELKEQQIQRYEACNYSTASFPRIVQVADALGLKFHTTKIKLQDSHLNVSENVIAKANALKNKLVKNRTLLLIE